MKFLKMILILTGLILNQTIVKGETKIVISKTGRSNIIRNGIETDTECDKVILDECFRIGAHYYSVDYYINDKTIEENLHLEKLFYMRYKEGQVVEICNSKTRLLMENNKLKISQTIKNNKKEIETTESEYTVGEIVIKCENSEMTIIENNKREWLITKDDDVFFNYWYKRNDNYSISNNELYTPNGVWKLSPSNKVVVKLLDNGVLEYQVYRTDCDNITENECKKYLGKLKCNEKSYTIYDKDDKETECNYNIIPN